jgi:hypothetical protein
MAQSISEEQVRALIAVRAYEMWENEGRPPGRDLIHWQQAEQEILICIRDSAAAGTRTVYVPAHRVP